MIIRNKNTGNDHYEGPITTLAKFVEEWQPVNIDEHGEVVREFEKLTVDQLEAIYWPGEIADIAKFYLSECDWIVTRSAERGESVPAEWKTYRDALRTLVDHQNDGNEVIWPTKP